MDIYELTALSVIKDLKNYPDIVNATFKNTQDELITISVRIKQFKGGCSIEQITTIAKFIHKVLVEHFATNMRIGDNLEDLGQKEFYQIDTLNVSFRLERLMQYGDLYRKVFRGK